MLTGGPNTVNRVAEPKKILPSAQTFDAAGNRLEHSFPANSVTVLRLKTRLRRLPGTCIATSRKRGRSFKG